MNKLLKLTKWGFTAMIVVSLVFFYACNDDENGGGTPVEEEAPDISYSASSVAVGSTSDLTPTNAGGDADSYALVDNDGADFVTIDTGTGVLSVGEESTTGTYTVMVRATNAKGNSDAEAEITITVNEEFDPSGKNLMWKYWMNNTENVAMLNLNLLPGQENLPASIDIPVGWPANWPAIDMMDPTLPSYFVFPTVQYFLMQVPGDNACDALDPPENGDTLLFIVNNDLSLSTVCRDTTNNEPATTVDLGTSEISYSGGLYTWSMDLTLEGVPVTIAIGSAEIGDFIDPLDPHWEAPSGTPRTFTAITGNVEQYMTPTDFHPDNYFTSIQLLNVDVVLEILE